MGLAEARLAEKPHLGAPDPRPPRRGRRLTSKRAEDRVYDHEHCTVPEVDEELLKAGAKKELERLLAAHDDEFSARKQAQLAEVIALDDI